MKWTRNVAWAFVLAAPLAGCEQDDDTPMERQRDRPTPPTAPRSAPRDRDPDVNRGGDTRGSATPGPRGSSSSEGTSGQPGDVPPETRQGGSTQPAAPEGQQGRQQGSTRPTPENAQPQGDQR